MKNNIFLNFSFSVAFLRLLVNAQINIYHLFLHRIGKSSVVFKQEKNSFQVCHWRTYQRHRSI